MRQLSPSSYELGYFDQLSAVCTYTVITLGFALDNAQVSKQFETAKSQLQDAAAAMTTAFPWLAGKVVLDIPEEERETSSGTYSVSLDTKHEILTFKDLTSEFPSYKEITSAGAPISKLPGNALSTFSGLPKSYDPSKEFCPVFRVQANQVTGGLLLTFATQHNVSDMNGQGQLIRLFAQAMRGEDFTAEQLKWGNIDRRSVVGPVKDNETAPDFASFRSESKIGKDPWAGFEPVPAPWKVIRFRAAALKKLKERASTKPSNGSVTNGTSVTATMPSWISTNDAFTAFVWQAVTRARSSRLKDDDTIQLLRSVNGRRKLDPPIPEHYIGHMVAMTKNTSSLKLLEDSKNLAAIATDIRRTVYDWDDLRVRAFTALIGGLKDRTTVDYVAGIDFSRDTIFSSWGENRLTEQSFGVLGLPDWTRRPDFGSFESITYVAEKSREGDYYLQASFRAEDWEKLEQDEVFKEFAEIIG